MTSPLLEGKVEYRLNLVSSKRRKKQRLVSGARSIVDKEEDAVNTVDEAGFYFISSSNEEFLLSVPHNLRKSICDAARLQLPVAVSKYAIIPLSVNSTGGPRRRATPEIPALQLLDIQEDGFQLKTHTGESEYIQKEKFLSLQQLYFQEPDDSKEKPNKAKISSSHDNGRKKKKSFKCNFRGTVDSISPILAIDTPFAYMVLYDDESEQPYSCTVMMVGIDALICHDGIFPGDHIYLRNVKRKECKAGNRHPSYIFHISDASSLLWSPLPSTEFIIPPLPSTPVPMVSLQGRIVSRDEVNHDSGSTEGSARMIHSTTIELIQPVPAGPSLHVLYLVYYPMTPSLALSMQVGAVIQATNIHCIGHSNDRHYYGACLRSTISILQMPTSSSSMRVETLHYPSRPLYLRAVERSYMDYASWEEFDLWYRKNNFKQVEAPQGRKFPSYKTIKEVWKDLQFPKQEKRSRHADVEFFDHAHADDDHHPRGCPCSVKEPQRLPRWVTINDLRDHGIQILQKRLKNTILNLTRQGELKRLQIGWTGSIHLNQSAIAQYFFDETKDTGDNDSALFVGGMVMDGQLLTGSVNDRRSIGQELASASLANSHCILPATTIPYDRVNQCGGFAAEENHSMGGFAFGDLEGLVASSICLGVSSQSESSARALGSSSSCDGADNRALHLPLQESITSSTVNDTNTQTLAGACSLFRHQGMVFLLSIQLQLRRLINISSTTNHHEKFNTAERTTEPLVCTIQQVLDPESPIPGGENKNSVILGLLVRQKFRLSRNKNGCYRGLFLSLSHLQNPWTTRSVEEESVSTLQTISVKSSILYSHARAKETFVKKLIAKLDPATAVKLDDAMNIALAWWYVADNPRTCVIAAGGWDEVLLGPGQLLEKTKTILGVLVTLKGFPHQSDKRGYKRFQYPIKSICAQFLRVKTDGSPPRPHKIPSMLTEGVLDFVGGLTFLDDTGHVDRRPRRRLPKEVEHDDQAIILSYEQKGERLELGEQVSTGIPDCSLGEMLRYICMDLGNMQAWRGAGKNSTSNLKYVAPSLLRRLKGARNLGIDFCKVQLSCSACFEVLPYRRAGNNSFWHIPLPQQYSQNSFENENGLLKKKQKPSNSSRKSEGKSSDCPKGCPNGYPEIKWECSCIVDDGTGQAKLYAEREAAVMLLGMDKSVFDIIEAGIHQTKTSITFSRTCHPPKHLAEAVDLAMFKHAANKRENEKGQKIIRMDRDKAQEGRQILELLDPCDRATYLLYQHCRYSEAARRPLEYLVRCKPLPDRAIHLSHTQVDIFSPGPGLASTEQVLTYSLPKLGLKLVDCCVPTAASAFGVVEETFDLLRDAQARRSQS